MSEKERNRRVRFRFFMDGYYTARQAWWEAMEAATALYPTEVKEYREANPPLTFREYLIQSRGISR